MDESSAAHLARQGKAQSAGDAAAKRVQSIAAAVELLIDSRALVGDEVAAEARQGQAVLEEDGEGRDRAAEDEVVCLPVVGVVADLFGTGGEDRHVGEPERLDGVLEERSPLLRGLDEGVAGGAGDGEDEAGEPGAGADIGDAVIRGDLPYLEAGEGVEEVLDGDLAEIGDGGERRAAVVGEEEVEVGGVAFERALGEGDVELRRAVEEGALPVGGRRDGITHGGWVRRREAGTCERGDAARPELGGGGKAAAEEMRACALGR